MKDWLVRHVSWILIGSGAFTYTLLLLLDLIADWRLAFPYSLIGPFSAGFIAAGIVWPIWSPAAKAPMQEELSE